MMQLPKQRDVSLDRVSVLKGMQEAWLDHRHCRDQTWHSVTATVAMAVGFVTLKVQVSDPLMTAVAGAFVLAAAFCGMLLTRYHREYEIRKFTHIMQCEYWLRLRELKLRPDGKEYISESGLLHWARRPEGPPSDVFFVQMFLPWKQNTPLFIIRVHAAIYAFTALYLRQYMHAWGNRVAAIAGAIALAWIVVADLWTWRKRASEPQHSLGGDFGTRAKHGFLSASRLTFGKDKNLTEGHK